MSEYPENPGPLPAEKLCNKYNNPNPIKGEGALGNENTGKMYHEGTDRKSLVETLQKMLRDLKKYDLGSSGPDKDGVDGTFGNKTEDAVKQFQEKHKDWDGNVLKVDGLVGPETSDALNREMVGKWYDHYQTHEKLVKGVPYHTVTSEFLKEGLKILPEEAKRSKVFLVGLIPSIEVTCTVRVLGFDLEPVKEGTICEIDVDGYVQKTTTNKDGIATFNASDQTKCCHVKWELPVDGEGKLAVEREIILEPAEKEDKKYRLSNLGHQQAELSDQVRSYQREMDRDQTGDESHIAAEVRAWHDGGPKPLKGGNITDNENSGSVSTNSIEGDIIANQGSPSGTTTVGPVIRVEPYVENRKEAPHDGYLHDKTGSIVKMDILRGSHTAVRLINAAGLNIRSNNPDNAVPMDPAVWIDPGSSSSPRTIFFYGRRIPKRGDISALQHCTQFEVMINGHPQRCILVVCVLRYPNDIALIELMGNSLVLNAHDVPHPYHFPEQINIPKGRDPSTIINDVLARMQAKGWATLDHLIINAHGSIDGNTLEGKIHVGGVLTNSHFNQSIQSLDLWNRLSGKVKYIWSMACFSGQDQYLYSQIASRTGAWVTGPAMATQPGRRKVLQNNQIEYAESFAYNHWDGEYLRSHAGSNLPQETDLFFYKARRTTTQSNLGNSLYFNVVTKIPHP